MQLLTDILKESWALPLIQLLLGKLWKSHPALKNDLIPVLTFVAAAVGLQITPAVQGVTDPVLHAGLLTGLAATFTGAVTLIHSIGKTVFKPTTVVSQAAKLLLSPLGRLLSNGDHPSGPAPVVIPEAPKVLVP
jgi:hypothetical protein